MELTTRIRKRGFTAIMRQDAAYLDHPDHTTSVLCSRLAQDANKVQGCTGAKIGLVMKNLSSLGIQALVVEYLYVLCKLIRLQVIF